MPIPPTSSSSAIGSAAGRGHDARRALAAHGEQLAAEHLLRLGYEICARNHRTRHGELDIVAVDSGTLVFVEVKTRRAGRDVDPWDALHPRKRMKVRQMAVAYLTEEPGCPRGRPLRFDAVGVIIDARGGLVSLDHRENAF